MITKSARASRAIIVLFLVLALAAGLAAEPLLETQTSATADFSSLVASGPSILLWSDQRSATDSIDAWSAALRTAGSSFAVIRAADLAKLPFFVPRWTVKMMLSKTYPDDAFYLDFSGGLRKRYALPADAVVALALGPGGEARGRVVGTASVSGVGILLKALR